MEARIINRKDRVTLEASSEGSLVNYGSGVMISVGNDANQIENRTGNTTIQGGAGSDKIENRAENVYVDAGAGNDRIENKGSSKAILAFQSLAREIKNVEAIDKFSAEKFKDVIAVGIIDAADGTIVLPESTWTDYNRSGLEQLSDAQVAAKISRFIGDFNTDYLLNRKNADGQKVTASNTAMISSQQLTTTYAAASGVNSDVKVALANAIDGLNELFANQDMIRPNYDYRTGALESIDRQAVADAIADSDVNEIAAFLTDVSISVDGYSTIDSDTSLGDARSALTDLISKINGTLRTISLVPAPDSDTSAESVDTDTLNKGTLYLNMTPYDSGAASTLTKIRSIQFAADGSDFVEKFTELQSFDTQLYVYTSVLENFSFANALYYMIGNKNLMDVVTLHNFIKVKAYAMTNYDSTTYDPTTRTASPYVSDLYDPFFATIDDVDDTDSTVADVTNDYFRAHNGYDSKTGVIGVCNVDSTKYNELLAAFDSSDAKAKASYLQYYTEARDLYNHLQATAYASTLATDGSDLFALDEDAFKNLFALIPNDMSDNNLYAQALGDYKAIAALMDYSHARAVENATATVDADKTQSTFNGGAGNDTIRNFADERVTINGGAGNDLIENYWQSSLTAIDGGAGADSITNNIRAEYVTIRGGAGNDFIVNRSANVSISGGDDKDIISNDANGSLTAIDGGLGNDSIENAASRVTINAGAGNDSLVNVGNNVSLSGGAGADTLENRSDNSIVDGGEGNDRIVNKNSSNSHRAFRALAGAIDYVDEIDTFNAAQFESKLENGIVDTRNGTIALPDKTWEDFDHQTLSELSNAQISSKLEAFVASLNENYILNRTDADGSAISIGGAAIIDDARLMTDYAAASASNADVKNAMTNAVDNLNKVFAEQQMISWRENYNGSVDMKRTTVANAIIDHDVDEISSFVTDAAINVDGSTIDSDTSFVDAKSAMSSLVSKINKTLRSISLKPSEDDSALDQSKVYLNMTATDSGAASTLTKLRSIQFAADGSDFVENFNELQNFTDASLYRYSADYIRWIDSSALSNMINREQLMDVANLYNFIKVKAYAMTNYDETELYDPFDATLDKVDGLASIGFCNIAAAKYEELLDALDTSDGTALADYARYYGKARELYNHLQAKAYASSFAADGSNLLEFGSDEYKNLLNLIPSEAQEAFAAAYGQTAMLMDYYHSRALKNAPSIEEIASTIRGGAGNDTLVNGAEAFVYEFGASSGADVIEGYNSNSTIKITDGADYATLTSGSDVIVSVGAAAVKLNGAVGTRLNISGGTNKSRVNEIANTFNNLGVNGTASADFITNGGDQVTIVGNAGNDTIENAADKVLIQGGAGADVIIHDDKPTSKRGYAALIGEIDIGESKGVDYINKNTWDRFKMLIEPGIVDSTNGTIVLPDSIWEDYNLEQLSYLSNAQLASKVNAFVASLNATYLRNRTSADGLSIANGKTSTLSARQLVNDYGAANDTNAAVKVAMANTIDNLNELFADQNMIAYTETTNASGTSYEMERKTVADAIADTDDTVEEIYQFVTDAEINIYGVSKITSETSLGEARSVMSRLVSKINQTLRTISLKPSDDEDALDKSKLYLNMTATDSGAASTLTKLRGIQFAADGSDFVEKFNELKNFTDATLYRFSRDDNRWIAPGAMIYMRAFQNLLSVAELYNFIKVKAYAMTNYDPTTYDSETRTASPYNGFDKLCAPFAATLDDVSAGGAFGVCNINRAKYKSLLDAIDASDSRTLARYDRYYDAARDLYNHLQTKAYNTSFSTDGSDLFVIGSDDYNDLLALVPSGNPRSDFADDYADTAALTDYLHARLVQAAPSIEESISTIVGGAGNDTLVNKSEAFVYEFASTDGKDVIEGWTPSSTIRIADGSSYSTTRSGYDAIVNVGSGSITLKDAAYEKLNIVRDQSESTVQPTVPTESTIPAVDTINNASNNKKVSGTASAEWIVNSGAGVTIQGNSGDDTIVGSVNGELILVASNHGKDVITNFGMNDTLKSTAGDIKSIKTVGEDAVVSLKGTSYSTQITLQGAGAYPFKQSGNTLTVNAINNSANNKKVSGTASAEWIINSGSGVTIQGNGGDDTIVGSDNGELILVASNHGKDVITNFGMNDTLKCTAGDIKSIKTVGDDAVVSLKGTSYSTQITLQGAGAYPFKQSGNILTVNAINNSANNKKVSGTSKAEWIINSGSGVTIQGNAGDDTIVGSVNGELILVASNHGKDVITNFGMNDTLKCTAGDIKSIKTVGDDAVVSIKGTSYSTQITLQGAGAYPFKQSGNTLTVNAISNSANNKKISGTSKAEWIINSGSGVTIQGNAGDDTIVGSDNGELILVASNHGKDVITNFGMNDTLKNIGGNIKSVRTVGEDAVVSIKGTSYSTQITLQGAGAYPFKQSGNTLTVNAINNSANNKKVSGTSSAEWIVNSGSGVTIQGNAGADTIVGSDNGELILVASNHGKDVITNFGANDTLKSTAGDIKSIKTVGDDAVVSLKGTSYSTQITLQGAASYEFKQSGNTLTVKSVGGASAELPSAIEDYWFTQSDQFDQSLDEINSILSIENNSTGLEFDPNDRFKPTLELASNSARSRLKK